MGETDLDTVMSTQPLLSIKFDHKCYCYGWDVEQNPEGGYTYTHDSTDPYGFSTAWAQETGYHENKRPIEYYYCFNKGEGITIRDVIKQLEKDEYDPFCNHCFMEGIGDKDGKYVSPDKAAQMSICWGS